MRAQIWCMIFAAVMLLTGCKENAEINQYLEISYKASRHAPFGIFAAEYKEKIYFYSNETEKTGIYQMKLDGSEMKQCIPCADINGIQLINDTIYLLVEQQTNDEGDVLYDVECYSLEGKYLGKLMDDKLYSFFRRSAGVGGFFIDEYQNAFFNIISYNHKRGIVNRATYFKNQTWEPIGKVVENVTPESFCIDGKYFSIYKLEDNYLINSAGLKTPQNSDDGKLEDFAIDAYGYNSKFKYPWWNNKYNADKWKKECRIWDVTDNKILLTVNNLVLTYDINKTEITSTIEIPVDELIYINKEIVHVLRECDKLYVLLEYNTPSIFKKAKDESGQVLYEVDNQSGEIRKVHDCGTQGKVIYVEDDLFVCYEKNAFCLYEKKENESYLVWNYPVSNEIKDIGYQIDIAGSWIFVKHYDAETGKSRLVNKIEIPGVTRAYLREYELLKG